MGKTSCNFLPPLAACALTLAFAAGHVAAGGEAGDFSAVDALAKQAVAAGETPSVAFAIARDGEILHEGAFGLADREAGVAADVHTAYPLASATKPITATALMVLHERGALDLAMPLREALPAVAVRGEGADAITLTHLLTHTSGLGTYARIRYGDEIATTPSLADATRAYAVAVNPPGRIAEYSNLGYGLLGDVLAHRSGQPFAQVVEEQVFAPLRMADAFIDLPRPGQTNVAAHYDAAGIRLPPLRNDTPGAGNAYASARDLVRFAALHAGSGGDGAPLTRAGVAAMQARPGRTFQHYYGEAWYGLGWYVRDEGGRRSVWHEGGMPGGSAIIRVLPDDGLAVVVLANRTDANPLAQKIAAELLRVALPGFTPAPLDPVAAYVPFSGQSGFAGRWRGHVEVAGTRVPARLQFGDDGTVRLLIAPAGQPVVDASARAIVNGDSLVSAMPGRLPSADLEGSGDPLLLLKLVRNGDRIGGAIVAYASPQRLDYLLPFAVGLEREPTGDSAPSARGPTVESSPAR